MNVLVTGTSSGIGRATALHLAANGVQVFAACRRDSDGAELRQAGGERIVPVLLDVTHDDQIERAVKHIDQATAGAGLDGLVNNAGIGQSGPVELTSPESLKRIFDINLFGQLAMIRSFLPLLRRKRGRIVNIGSVGARLAIPFGGALCASKAAFEIFSDSLRMELRTEGIHVVVIQPGAVRTPAVDKTLGGAEDEIARWPQEMRSRYGAMFRIFTAKAAARENNGSDPTVIARVIHRALTAARPKIRYHAGKDSTLLAALPRLLPDRALDALRTRLLGLNAS
ncbi:MAG TPA: SDR family oxidoreductase [Reyranella sp.]|nr:SDR family oxidoreductase [Reyranella sp.]